MHVVIRTDASLEIGTGHVMRCFALAKQLERDGISITFVCRKFPGNNISFLQSQGFNVYSLFLHEINDHWKWMRENWKQDANETKFLLASLDKKVDLLIVDHYGLDKKWESELRPYVNNIMVIDDLANRAHDCDILVDQNYYLNMEERYQELVSDSCIQLLGPNYVMLRDEFLSIDTEKIKREGKVENILIFFGGTDPTEETFKTIRAIQKIDLQDIQVNVVVGESNPQKSKIESICKIIPNVTFYCQINNMAELMLKADLAIGAAGTATWERCFLKLPSLTIIVAENQYEIAYAVATKGATICLGESREITESHIQEEILKFLEYPDIIVEMSSNCLQILDPQFVKRNETSRKIRSFIFNN